MPLKAGHKAPPPKDWQRLASSCPMVAFDAWTNADGSVSDANIAIVGKDHVILDVDVPGESHSIDGAASLATLGWSGRTFAVASPSGGRHLYFKKPAGQDFSQCDLAPGVNVRSTGGYVLGPGSWTKHIAGVQAEGFYTIIDDSEPAELPECIRALLTPAGAEVRYDESSYSGEWDHKDSLEWCWRYVREFAPFAVKGSRGRKGLEIAHVLGDRAILKPTALEMLQEWHSLKCDPPEDDENQMEHVLNSAYSNRQRPFGIDCTHDWLKPVEVPRTLLDAAPAAKPPPVPFEQRVRKSRVRCAEDVRNIPRIPWLVRGKLIKGAITGLVSPPGVGKSTLTLQWACALAMGDGAFTGLQALENAEPLNSLVIGIEDTIEIMESRLAAMCGAFALDYEAIADRVHLYSGLTDGALTLMGRKDKRSMLAETDDAARLEKFIADNQIKAIFLDPLVEIHDGEENDNGEMRKVMALVRSLATKTQCAVVIVHHTRKPPQASSDSYAGDQFAGRGASSIPAAFRIGMTLFNASDKDVERYPQYMSAETKNEWVRLDDSKANWSQMSPFAQWFKRETVPLANGESASIMRPQPIGTGDDKSAQMLAEEIAGCLKPGQSAALGAICAALAARPTYASKSERTLRRSVRELLLAGDVTTASGVLTFTASGKEGGTVTLS